ncbi:MAG: YdcF family protein [Lachnospiraceae bacterium]|nr:YdcF family protein [Lachnospiraceae bacterium]
MKTEEYPLIRRRDVRKKPPGAGRIVFSILLFLLAALALGYGAVVWSVHSGSPFFLVWLGLGAFFLLLGILTAAGVWRKVPKAVKIIIYALIAAGIVLVAVTWSLILPHFSDRGKPGADAVIVLGAQVRKSGPSTILKYRLDAAVSYLEENPDAVCIVSGAQGRSEPFTEARGMADYLQSQGIPEDHIILEEKAETSAENLKYSRELLPAEDSSVVLVTNNFHMYRALAIARKQGYSDVSGLASGSPRLFLLNNMLYESAAIVKNRLLGTMD